jgi:hypothetical protein
VEKARAEEAVSAEEKPEMYSSCLIYNIFQLDRELLLLQEPEGEWEARGRKLRFFSPDSHEAWIDSLLFAPRPAVAHCTGSGAQRANGQRTRWEGVESVSIISLFREDSCACRIRSFLDDIDEHLKLPNWKSTTSEALLRQQLPTPIRKALECSPSSERSVKKTRGSTLGRREALWGISQRVRCFGAS